MSNGRGARLMPGSTEDLGAAFCTAEIDFVAELKQVRAGRVWLRSVLSAGCTRGDDCVLVLSELLANAAEHGRGHRVTAAITHGRGWVRGALVEHGVSARTPLPRANGDALMEMGRLLAVPVDEPVETVPVEELAERGRGLAVVALLCRGVWDLARDGERFVTRWELRGCACAGAGLVMSPETLGGGDGDE